MPRCLRRSAYSSANLSVSSEVRGSSSVAAETSTPMLAAWALIRIGSPSSVRSATPRRSSRSAARRMRSSSPSGSTMCRRRPAATSTSWCSNISGVTAVVRDTSSRSSRATPSTCWANSARAAAIFRGELTVSRPRTEVSAAEVSWVARSVAMIGMVAPMPSSSRATWAGSSMPPFRTIADTCGKFAERWAISTPSTTSGRSPAVTTTAPSKRRSSTFGIVIPATSRPSTSRSSRAGSPETSVPSQAGIRSATDGAESSGSLGIAYAGTSARVSAVATPAGSGAVTRLATTANSVAWFAEIAPVAMSARVTRSSAVRSAPLSTSRIGELRFAAILAL